MSFEGLAHGADRCLAFPEAVAVVGEFAGGRGDVVALAGSDKAFHLPLDAEVVYYCADFRVCEVVAPRIVFFVAVMSPFESCEIVSMAVIVVPLAVGSLFAVCLSL